MKLTPLVAFFLVAPFPGVAHGADARELAQRVAQSWKKSAKEVRQLPARFFVGEETQSVTLPPPGEAKCAHLAIVGPRSASFYVGELGLSSELRTASVGGVVTFTRCRDRGIPLRVLVASTAGRGAYDFVWAASDDPLESINSLLPERVATIAFLPQDPGAGPPTALRPVRVEAARRRVTGAGKVDVTDHNVESDGSFVVPFRLDAGCHRIDVIADPPDVQLFPKLSTFDVDAELREEPDGRIVARDRTDAGDARLEFCLGENAAYSVSASGAHGAVYASVVHFSWPLPPGVPTFWGPDTVGKLAYTAHVRNFRFASNHPVLVFQGAGGTTRLPIQLEPLGCYAVLVATRSEAGRGLSLRVMHGPHDYVDERGVRDHSAAVAFCVRPHEPVMVEIDARGSGVSWGLVVLRTARPR